ncbi:MAG: SoxR reducing system RseC family protein [Clostridia bacterium]|nr:SoxR reducing system RseC family protein [Clostridia bacterium]
MSEIWGMVMKRQGERAEVKIDRTKTTVEHLPKYLDCWNPISAKAGEIVGIEYQELSAGKAKLITYGFPVLGILAGLACGHSIANFFQKDPLWFIVVSAILWLGVTINYARIFKRDAVREGAQPTIVEVKMFIPKITEENSVKPNENTENLTEDTTKEI